MAPRKTISPLLVVSLLLLTEFARLGATQSAAAGGGRRCVETERHALLEFKAGLQDRSGWLSSWAAGEDCCNWTGIMCSNQTSNVVKLDLKSVDSCDSIDEDGAPPNKSCLGGTLNPSLLHLKYLNYLDLSRNNFQEIPIPNFIGSFQRLTYLDLSLANFSGMVPTQLGNLSQLVHLDLTTYSYPNYLWVSDLNWLSGLPSLQYLVLNGVNLRNASANWLSEVNMLPSLLELHLSSTELQDLPQSLPVLNLTSLLVLDLSENQLSSSLPQWLYNISTLQQINFGSCQLEGSIPEPTTPSSLCNLQMLDLSFNSLTGDIKKFIDSLAGCNSNSLETLDVQSNNLNGHLPDSIGLLSNLMSLELSNNKFTGPIPTSLWNISQLGILDLSYNMMHGTLPEIGRQPYLSAVDLFGNLLDGIVTESFLNLTILDTLSLSSTSSSLVFNLRDDWIPPFSLYSISITGCQLGPAFPGWLKTQTKISEVTLSNCLLSDNIPDWIWTFSSWLSWLDLSSNQFRGALPNSVHFVSSVDLSFNQLEGPVPIWPNVTNLSLKRNLISGPIPLNFGVVMSGLLNLDISQNYLSGTIPASMSNLTSLSFLDLSSNNLSGLLPVNLHSRSLSVIDLSHNNLSGGIPGSLCALHSLYWLKLNNNNLHGEVSSTLLNCASLLALEIGRNRFYGTIPYLPRSTAMSYLGLRGNMLTGTIPQSLCNLRWLQILDLAHNKLSGPIPKCVNNFIALRTSGIDIPPLPSSRHYAYFQHTELVLKGRAMEYTDRVFLVKIIDFSANNLSGEIPEEITRLSTLGTLNLSMNQLTGKIPEGIGKLQVETLDLSLNHLSGPIPASMASMTALNHLNLSFNNLSGPIPSANQFLTFTDPSIYEGNPYLCGPPLSNSCSTSNSGNAGRNVPEDTDGDEYESLGFYGSIAAGFIVGFWGVCGSLVFKKSWRYAFFRFVNETKDWVFVVVTVCIPRMGRQT